MRTFSKTVSWGIRTDRLNLVGLTIISFGDIFKSMCCLIRKRVLGIFLFAGTWLLGGSAADQKGGEPGQRASPPRYGWTAADLDRKLKIIRFPEVEFFKAPLPDVLNYIQEHSAKYDPEAKANPKFAGVQLVLLTREKPPPLVTIKLRNARLSSILDFTMELIGYDYQVRDAAIVVFKPKPKPVQKQAFRPLETEFFELSEDLIRRLGGR